MGLLLLFCSEIVEAHSKSVGKAWASIHKTAGCSVMTNIWLRKHDIADAWKSLTIRYYCVKDLSSKQCKIY